MEPKGSIEARKALQAACDRAGGRAAFAEQHGLHKSAITMILNGARPMSERVANLIGYELVFMPRRTKKS